MILLNLVGYDYINLTQIRIVSVKIDDIILLTQQQRMAQKKENVSIEFPYEFRYYPLISDGKKTLLETGKTRDSFKPNLDAGDTYVLYSVDDLLSLKLLDWRRIYHVK